MFVSGQMFKKQCYKNTFFFFFNKKHYFLFRHSNRYVIPQMWYNKVFLNTGLYGKCFLVLKKHNNSLLGEYRLTRKLYNSSIVLKKQKR